MLRYTLVFGCPLARASPSRFQHYTQWEQLSFGLSQFRDSRERRVEIPACVNGSESVGKVGPHAGASARYGLTCGRRSSHNRAPALTRDGGVRAEGAVAARSGPLPLRELADFGRRVRGVGRRQQREPVLQHHRRLQLGQLCGGERCRGRRHARSSSRLGLCWTRGAERGRRGGWMEWCVTGHRHPTL